MVGKPRLVRGAMLYHFAGKRAAPIELAWFGAEHWIPGRLDLADF